MSVSVPIVKMNGTKNEFVVLDHRSGEQNGYPKLAVALCDPQSGFEADGLLVILPSREADARMRMFNPDGTEAEMCGNGIRCVARYLVEAGGPEHATIETIAGPIRTDVVGRDPFLVRAAIGSPQVGEPRELSIAGRTLEYVPVSVGNPHVVIFTDDVMRVDLEFIGPQIEKHPAFPEGTNVHFCVVEDRKTLRARHWERGAGATLACGTGATACAAAAIVRGIADSPVDVWVPGGRLIIEWDGRGEAFMTGEVEREFETVAST
ncbi:MAG TPA: diaminopimelate epimerase [Candidatus Binatia bacterium]|nr:diaminopimelate epimerase [Candidatus Binatia bacterium]